ncbi:MAG: glycosyltransferase family 32 protein [Thermoleophilaceae bacterium]
MIPRIVHRIWLGPNPMPEEHAAYGESWAHHHPAWEMRLWTDEDLPGLSTPLLERARNLVERADILRIELLRRFGGVYVDTDFECLRPIDPLLENVGIFAARVNEERINNAILGSTAGHPAWDRVLATIDERMGSIEGHGAAGAPAIQWTVAEEPDYVAFPPELFYPYSAEEWHRRHEHFPDAYAVHHWAYTWKWQTREDILASVSDLTAKLERAREQRERERERAERSSVKAAALEERLTAIESSRWWRARERLAKAARRRRNG